MAWVALQVLMTSAVCQIWAYYFPADEVFAKGMAVPVLASHATMDGCWNDTSAASVLSSLAILSSAQLPVRVSMWRLCKKWAPTTAVAGTVSLVM